MKISKFVLRLGLLLGIVTWQSPAQAFINIESLRQNIKKGFSGSSGVTMNGASGNVRVFGLGVNSQNLYKDDTHEYIFLLDYKYGEAQRVKNNNQGSTHLRFAEKFTEALAWETFGQIEFNEFQSLSLRALLGAGFRARLWKDQKNSLYLGLGTFYEDEKIKNDADQANFRGNLYMSFRSLFAENMESVLVLYYQPNYRFINDYRLRATLGLETKINEILSLVNSFSYAQDTKPPAGIQQDDLSYKVIFNFSY